MIKLHIMYTLKYKKKNNRVILFTRFPVPGKTKTRLIPSLGPVGAADFQWNLILKSFKTVKNFCDEMPCHSELCMDGPFPANSGRLLPPFLYSRQTGENLGERMHKAFINAFQEGGHRVLLLGSDVPELSTHHLAQAFEKLLSHDVVIGPSTDGGYWLIGMKRPLDLFTQIKWGVEDVLEKTLKKISEQSLSVYLTEPLTDVDTPENLYQLYPDYRAFKPYLSVIIPALNEANHISASVKSAICSDSEVIVVDGGSTDSTIQKAESAGASVIHSKPGRAVQQNNGTAVARGKILLFLHADTLLPENFAHHVFDIMIDRKTILGAFRFRTDANGFLMGLVHLLTNLRSGYFNLPYGDQAFFLRKDIFEKIKGFPEVPIAEDLYLVKKLSRQGKITVSPYQVITSGRRWQRLGVVPTTLVNQVILAGCLIGVSPDRLASFYRYFR